MRELDDGDKKLLQKANHTLATANAILQFLADHFRDKYHLPEANQITPDGVILDGTFPPDSGVPPSENGRDSETYDLRSVPS